MTVEFNSINLQLRNNRNIYLVLQHLINLIILGFFLLDTKYKCTAKYVKFAFEDSSGKDLRGVHTQSALTDQFKQKTRVQNGWLQKNKTKKKLQTCRIASILHSLEITKSYELTAKIKYYKLRNVCWRSWRLMH